MKRMTILKATGAAVLASTGAQAQAWPNRPITMLVPFAAGGPSDMFGRILARGLSPLLGQQVVVENKGGMGGIVGVAATAKAVPDGYTIGMGPRHLHRIAGVVAVHGKGRDEDRAIDADLVHRRHHLVAGDVSRPVRNRVPGPLRRVGLIGMNLGIDNHPE